MNPSALIPAPDALPAPAGLFEALSMLTLAVHLLLMNATVGGAAVAVMERLRAPASAPPDPFAKALPAGLALTVNFGVPPLLFAQILYGQFLYPSAILMAFFWLGVAGLAMAAYYGLYLNVALKDSKGMSLASLGLSTLMLAAVGFTLTNVMTLMLAPERWSAWFANDAGTILNWTDPSLLPRWLHFMLAALAVGGLAKALWHEKRDPSPEAKARAAFGLACFNGATMAQFVVGGWFFLSLPREIQMVFMGGDLMATAGFGLALAGAAVTLAMGLKGRIGLTALGVPVVVLLMVATRARLRDAFLAPHAVPAPVHFQVGPLVLFLGSLVVTAALVAWMVGLSLRATKQAAGRPSPTASGPIPGPIPGRTSANAAGKEA